MAIPKEARKLNRHFNSENRRNTGRNYRLRHTMVNPAGGGTVANLTGIEVCTIDPNKVGKSIPKKGKAPGELYTASPRHMRQLFIDLPQGAALTKIPIVLLFKTPEACYMDKLHVHEKIYGENNSLLWAGDYCSNKTGENIAWRKTKGSGALDLFESVPCICPKYESGYCKRQGRFVFGIPQFPGEVFEIVTTSHTACDNFESNIKVLYEAILGFGKMIIPPEFPEYSQYWNSLQWANPSIEISAIASNYGRVRWEWHLNTEPIEQVLELKADQMKKMIQHASNLRRGALQAADQTVKQLAGELFDDNVLNVIEPDAIQYEEPIIEPEAVASIPEYTQSETEEGQVIVPDNLEEFLLCVSGSTNGYYSGSSHCLQTIKNSLGDDFQWPKAGNRSAFVKCFDILINHVESK